ERDNLTKSLSCVAMMILLAAESLDLGACYMTGPLVAGKKLNQELEIRDNFILGAIIPIGFKLSDNGD
ncbi:MAG: nitroreductase family protein, partial [Bacteroidales bacterium]|nr:nitroreductase family protein [Bacteroidales bacterium]